MTPAPNYCLVLDSGTMFGNWLTREEAHERAIALNTESAIGRARGDLVTLRRVIGVVHVKHKPLRMIEKPKPKRGRPRKVRP